jgi:hypothetical protein
MRKRRHNAHKSKSSNSKIKSPELKVTTAQELEDRVIDLHRASEYWRRLWGIYWKLYDMEQLPPTKPDCYRLPKGLHSTLKNLLSGKIEKNSADAKGKALWHAVTFHGVSVDDSDGDFSNWPLWGSDLPIANSWADLKEFPVPSGVEKTLRFENDDWVEGPARPGYEPALESSQESATEEMYNFSCPPPPSDTDAVRVVVLPAKTRHLS